MHIRDIERQRYAMNYIYPGLLYLLVVLIVPLFFSIVVSFFKWDLIGDTTKRFIGLKNYVDIFEDEEVVKSIYLTGKFLFWSVGFELILGFLIALFLNRDFKGNKIVRVVVLLPMMMSPTIIALSWKLILNYDRGILNYILDTLFGSGTGQVWLGPQFAMTTLIAIEIWLNTPFVVLMLLAGLQSIPTDVIEASLVDGASLLQRTFRITIPLLKPVFLVAIIFRTTFAIRNFPLPWVLTSGGPANKTNVFGIELYRQAFTYYHIGYSSALSWLLILITFALSIFYVRITLRKETKHE